MNRMWQDIQYAARILRRRPAFTSAAVVSLAIGIGACAAIFSVVDAVLLRSLPYPEADRIVQLREADDTGFQMSVAEPNYLDVRARMGFRHSSQSRLAYYLPSVFQAMARRLSIKNRAASNLRARRAIACEGFSLFRRLP
jgi:hypothetical protein